MSISAFLEPRTEKRSFSLSPRNVSIIILLAALFALYGLFLAHKIDLTTADLGRHIKNGEMLSENPAVLSTNFYSYTHSDFHVLNHHWASGVLFYFAWKIGGFAGVQLFFIALLLAALATFLLAARWSGARWGFIGFAALLAIPLLAERTEIRPEVFSYFFAGLFFLILARRSYTKALWLLPLIEIAWVNTHIYFLLGPLLIGAFLVESLLRKNRERVVRLLSVFGATIVATLANPFGWRALAETFSIFEHYGYRLAENQSVWFLKSLGMGGPNFWFFQFALALLALSFLWLFFKHRSAFRPAHFFVVCGIGTLAVLAERNMAFFGFFLIPLLSNNLHSICGERARNVCIEHAAAWSAAVFLLVATVFSLPRSFPYWRTFGVGLENGNSAAANFLREQNIRGPYFNNYDIGGYLIFHLFPRERVFVDNRPEAYPAAFFQEEYIPMQENEQKWGEALARYKFNAIVFSHRDATPWGQTFLRARVEDPLWKQAFIDERIIIFTRVQ